MEHIVDYQAWLTTDQSMYRQSGRLVASNDLDNYQHIDSDHGPPA